jgi:predicted metal-dependent phosphoesterase TrpH
MIDMHLHTYYSDGTMSPHAIVKRASALGMKTIAITDHDGVDGVEEAQVAGKKLGVKVIPGIELSSSMSAGELGLYGDTYKDHNINMHILGYEIDIKDDELNKAIKKVRRWREDRNRDLLTTLNSIGFDISKNDLLQREGQDYVGKPNFVLALMKKGYIRSSKEASMPGRFLKHPSVQRVHRRKMHAEEAIDLIKGAGGFAVLAHPMKIKFPRIEKYDMYKSISSLLDKLLIWGLSGMECYYSGHTEEETARLLSIAKGKKMIITAGSDFHGFDFDPHLDIGITGLPDNFV